MHQKGKILLNPPYSINHESCPSSDTDNTEVPQYLSESLIDLAHLDYVIISNNTVS